MLRFLFAVFLLATALNPSAAAQVSPEASAQAVSPAQPATPELMVDPAERTPTVPTPTRIDSRSETPFAQGPLAITRTPGPREAVVREDIAEPTVPEPTPPRPAQAATEVGRQSGFTPEMAVLVALALFACVIIWLAIMHGGQRRRVREEIERTLNVEREALEGRIRRMEEEHLEEIGRTEGRLSKRLDDTSDRLERKIDEGDTDVRQRLDSAETRLIDTIERERVLVHRQLEGHARLREDQRSQRRIDAVVEVYDDQFITEQVERSAEESVRSYGRLIAAGIRDLRNDIECIHTINRLVHRGQLEGLDHDLMRRILAVGVKRFFVALEYNPQVVADEPSLTMARVRQTLARLETEREADPLEHFIPAQIESMGTGQSESGGDEDEERDA